MTAPPPRVLAAMTARPLVAAYLRVMLGYDVVYCVFYGVTAWLEQGRGLPESTTGVVILPGAVVALIVAVVLARTGVVATSMAVTLVATAIGVGGLALLDSTSGLALIVLVLTVFGGAEGAVMLGNQAVVHDRAPAAMIGLAAGLLRTAMYLGAIGSSALTAVVFRDGASDPGLHAMVAALAAFVVALAAVTVPGLLSAWSSRRPASG